MDSVDFGNKLIEVRKHKGLTQGEVAEICNVTIRTIQRIESGIVKPRASTIKIISQTLGFDFFETSDTGYDEKNENQTSKLKDHTFLWYVKDLFNLKTNAMRKISIWSVSTCLIIFMFVSIFNANAQADNVKRQKSLTIQRNEDNTIKRVEAAFTYNLTLDSLVQIKRDLQNIGITIHYKKIEFNVHNLLISLDCEVISNDGYSGSFGMEKLNMVGDKRYGFYRDYSPNSKSPFGTGLLDRE